MGAICVSSLTVVQTDQDCANKTSLENSYRLINSAAVGDIHKFSSLLHQNTDVDVCDSGGRTALHLACAEGHTEIVRILIDRKANFDVTDRWGSRPLQEAFAKGHKSVVDLLLLAGAGSDELRADMEKMLLSHAAKGDMNGVRNLLEAGISVNAQDSLGRTSLHIASEAGNRKLAHYLLSSGAIPSRGAKRTPAVGSDSPPVSAKDPPPPRLASSGPSQESVPSSPFTLIEALPPPIALARLQGRPAAPVLRGCASLFFSDITGFTTLCAGLSARAVARLLDDLFRRLDRLAYIHGVQVPMRAPRACLRVCTIWGVVSSCQCRIPFLGRPVLVAGGGNGGEMEPGGEERKGDSGRRKGGPGSLQPETAPVFIIYQFFMIYQFSSLSILFKRRRRPSPAPPQFRFPPEGWSLQALLQPGQTPAKNRVSDSAPARPKACGFR